jgi:hypothetical protein
MRCPECGLILGGLGNHWKKHAESRKEFEEKYPQFGRRIKDKKNISFESSTTKPWINRKGRGAIRG